MSEVPEEILNATLVAMDGTHFNAIAMRRMTLKEKLAAHLQKALKH